MLDPDKTELDYAKSGEIWLHGMLSLRNHASIACYLIVYFLHHAPTKLAWTMPDRKVRINVPVL